MDGLSNTVINSRRQTSGYSHSSHPLPHGTCLVGVTKRKYDSFFFFHVSMFCIRGEPDSRPWGHRFLDHPSVNLVPTLHFKHRWLHIDSKGQSAFWLLFSLLSCVWLFATSWTAACQDSLFFCTSQSWLRLTSIESVMPSNHLILCHPFSSCNQRFYPPLKIIFGKPYSYIIYKI